MDEDDALPASVVKDVMLMTLCEHQEYYFIEDAAREFNCTVTYLIHMGATGKMKLATNVNFCGKKYKAEPHDTSDITVFYDGFYYVSKRDLQSFEFDKSLNSISISKIYPVEREKRNYGKYFHPLPTDYIDDKPLEYVYFDNEIKVNKNKLIVYYDDIIKLLSKETPKLEDSVPSPPRKESRKANESLMKMVIAMAIDGYGYNPDEKKSPFPTELTTIIQNKNGLTIDVDTVRKWLKESAALLEKE